MDKYELHIGDALTILKTIPDQSVHCWVTSPPYWGLRDYGVDGQLGLEKTPAEYVCKMVEIFREARRVLRDDGTLWLNLGDSYCASATWSVNDGVSTLGGGKTTQKIASNRPSKIAKGYKPKDLVGIPWLVAFALRADGWYLRQDIIWHKPNPMPESVRDRCTKAHEYIFLMSKSERYYYDIDAIKEPCARGDAGSTYNNGKTAIHLLNRSSEKPRKQRKPAGWDTGAGGHGSFHRDGRAAEVEYTESYETERNRRSVWTVPTHPFPQAHFATFPPALIEPCILAGCPEGGVVGDMFAGSGTTGEVALKHFRRFVGIELNQTYANEMAIPRIAREAGRPKQMAILGT